MNWYVSRLGNKSGPFADDELQQLVERGDLKPNDLLWHEGATDWQVASHVPGLFSISPSPGSAIAEAIPAEVTQPEKPKSSNYFVRHWRGELALPIAYWVNGVVAGVAYAILAALVGTADISAQPTLISLVILFVLAISIPATVWQFVGIWRAAREYLDGKGKVWGFLARAAVVLGTIQSVRVVLASTFPAMGAMWLIAVGDEELSGYEIRVLAEPTELEISGPIGFGLEAKVSEILSANPDIRTVHLNSLGGRIAEARKLAQLIESRGLNTITTSGCFSACTMPFMAGMERRIGPGAELGFHRFSFPGTPDEVLKAEEERYAEYLRGRGLSRGFVERILETPSTGLWKPSYEELLDGGAVTFIAESD